MACDQIVAENLTLTGSIGVVTAKFNAQKLSEKLGVNTDTISIGRYAELFTTSRGFTEEEAQHFADLARRFYDSFVAKAAASRNLTVAALEEVAQGRVWTGQQARQKGLVDHLGGLWVALQVAHQLAHPTARNERPTSFRVQTLRDPRSGFPALSLLQSLLQSALQSQGGGPASRGEPWAVWDQAESLSAVCGTSRPAAGGVDLISLFQTILVPQRWF